MLFQPLVAGRVKVQVPASGFVSEQSTSSAKMGFHAYLRASAKIVLKYTISSIPNTKANVLDGTTEKSRLNHENLNRTRVQLP